MIFQFKNVNLGYENRVFVRDLNFTVEDGDYFCIVGGHDSGKSTVITAMLGFLKPLSGEIESNIESITNGGIGYVPQRKDYDKGFPSNVGNVVLSGALKKHGVFYSKADRDRAKACMERLGIYNLRKQKFSQLSGGQKQRVLLARALCTTDEVIVLDEPIIGLDAMATTDFFNIMRRLQYAGVTIIMATHDIESAKKYGDHILELKNGEGKLING